jgi:O-Antigen ligase
LLCALSLLATVVLVKRRSRFGSWAEIAVSLVLLTLALISGILSSTPQSSLYRGLVVMGSGLGGFWCARALVQCSARQEFFKWFCVVLLAAILCLSVLGYVTYGSVEALLDDNPHPLSCRILLLAFAPVALVLTRNRPAMILGGLMLCLCYLVFYLSSLRSATLIPLVLGIVAVWTGLLRLKYFLLLLIPLVLIIAFFFHKLPSVKIGPEFEPAYYRVENYPFSWHVAAKHPFFGIGLRAPRDEYLKDYQTKYPYSTKEEFRESLNRIVSSENTFLSFMVDLGFPFLIIYCTGVSVLCIRLVRMVKNPRPGIPLPPLALLLSIVAGLLHFQVLDGLFHPQVSWFFHILLGLIPLPPAAVDGAQSSAPINSFVQSIK